MAPIKSKEYSETEILEAVRLVKQGMSVRAAAAIVREVDPPIPVSSRLWGLDKDTVKDIESKMRLKWVVYYCFSVLICLFNCPCPVLYFSVLIFPFSTAAVLSCPQFFPCLPVLSLMSFYNDRPFHFSF